MSTDFGRRRPARAVAWHPIPWGGGPTGGPPDELVYITPKHLGGLTELALRNVDRATQNETALFWFLANLKPYDLAVGVPLFGYASKDASGAMVGGFPQGSYVPPPLASLDVLRGEFGALLGDEVLVPLAETLGDNWMWIGAKPPTEINATPEKLRQDVLKALDELAAQLKQLGPEHGAKGHNQPEGLPLTADEQNEALEAVGEIREAVAQRTRRSVEWLQARWSAVSSAAAKAGLWAGGLLANFVADILREGGPAIGKKLPHIIMVGLALAADNPALFRLIEALFK